MGLDHHRWKALAVASVTTAATLLGVSVASATSRSMFKPPFDFSIRDSRQPPAPGGPRPYTATGLNAAWSVIAWNIPGGDLPSFQRSKKGADTIFVSHAAEASVTVEQQPDGQARYSLSQDGAALPCNTSEGRPRESDFFAHPNEAQNKFETNAHLAKTGSVKINNLASSDKCRHAELQRAAKRAPPRMSGRSGSGGDRAYLTRSRGSPDAVLSS